MSTRFPLQSFFKTSQNAWADLPDHRKPSPNTKYSLSDAVNSALSVFFMQSHSFLSHHRSLKSKRSGRTNLQNLFEVENIPSDGQIRNLLDPIQPKQFVPQFEWIWRQLKGSEGFKGFQSSLGYHFVALDGMIYHSSTQISCENCSTRRDKKGITHYYHSTLLPVMVHPSRNEVLPFFPEMIVPQDGAEKQDCERNAAKRWIASWSHLFEVDSVTFLGDDLFCNQPFCEAVLEKEQHFLFVCKPDSHKTLYQWLASLTPNMKQERRWNGRHSEIWQWEWVNSVPLRAGEDALDVNWCQFQIIHADTGKILYKNSWATNHLLDEANIEIICQFGRTRWKIENEGINVLKNQGYHVEHNFGHGKMYLAQVFLILNLLAFFLHTAMHIMDNVYKYLRKSLHKRVIFFDDIRALCRYNYFDNWEDLWLFMLKSLDEGDLSPDLSALILK